MPRLQQTASRTRQIWSGWPSIRVTRAARLREINLNAFESSQTQDSNLQTKKLLIKEQGVQIHFIFPERIAHFLLTSKSPILLRSQTIPNIISEQIKSGCHTNNASHRMLITIEYDFEYHHLQRPISSLQNERKSHCQTKCLQRGFFQIFPGLTFTIEKLELHGSGYRLESQSNFHKCW